MIFQTSIHKAPPVNWGATVPRFSFENLNDDKMADLYCSRTGSIEVRIISDAACSNHIMKQGGSYPVKSRTVSSQENQLKTINDNEML